MGGGGGGWLALETESNSFHQDAFTPFTLFSVAPIPARNTTWPKPRETTRLTLTCGKGPSMSLIENNAIIKQMEFQPMFLTVKICRFKLAMINEL